MCMDDDGVFCKQKLRIYAKKVNRLLSHQREFSY